MTLRPQFMHSFLIGACACAALAASPFANSQSPAPAMPHEQEVQPARQAQPDETPGFGDNTAQRRDGYRSFLLEMAGEERHIQWQMEQGQAAPRSLVNWAKLLGIREDEDQAMHVITSDANRRIKEIDDQGLATSVDLSQDRSPQQIAKFTAHREEVGRERTEVLDETISKLRRELGEEDFKKLDAYVYRTSSAGTTAMEAKRRQKDQDLK